MGTIYFASLMGTLVYEDIPLLVGTVKATEYVISEHEIVNQATPSTAASYKNITGTIYINSATNVILGLNINVYDMHVKSGTTPLNETYTSTGYTYTIDLSSTNVVPVHTELTGAYIGIGVAIVLLCTVAVNIWNISDDGIRNRFPDRHISWDRGNCIEIIIGLKIYNQLVLRFVLQKVGRVLWENK